MTSTIEQFDLTEPTPYNVVRMAWLRVMIEDAMRGSDPAAATYLDAKITAGDWRGVTEHPDVDVPAGSLLVTVDDKPLCCFDVGQFNAIATRILERILEHRPEGITVGDLAELVAALRRASDPLAGIEQSFTDDA